MGEYRRVTLPTRQHPESCVLHPPVANMCFVHELADEGLSLPDDLLQLFTFYDGFDLSFVADPARSNFSLLSSTSLEIEEQCGRFPRRINVFQGDEESTAIAVYSRAGQWRMVFCQEYEPVADAPFDLPALLKFAIKRQSIAEEILDAVDTDPVLSWSAFFGNCA
jgi:hypothetical protein